jgi:predicted DNA-binding transcriptional regulator AlpA
MLKERRGHFAATALRIPREPGTVATKPKRKKRQRKKLPLQPVKRRHQPPAAPAQVDDPAQRPIRFLTKVEVCNRVRLSFPTIWKRMREGTFPRARETTSDQQTNTKVFWLEHEIEEWMLALPARQYLGEVVKVGCNVRIKGSPHHTTIMRGGAQSTMTKTSPSTEDTVRGAK